MPIGSSPFGDTSTEDLVCTTSNPTAMRLLVEEYAQKASAVSSLRAILEGYPLSAAILREIVQNSEDAGASTQIFVLDQRNHSTEGLFSEGLASTQGPAFMAFNDAVLTTQNWQALSAMHDSSKTADESKIGTYGVGFRSVFNLTDSPQILSGQHLAIFDPLCLHLGSEGKKIDLGHVASVFPNQLVPFDFFVKGGLVPPFRGAVIRCPLRTSSSRISDQVIQCETISRLFKEFIDQEMDISCLFLNNVSCIEVHEIARTGFASLLAKVVISRCPVSSNMSKVAIQLDRNQTSKNQEWLVAHSKFSRDEAITLLLEQPGYNPSTIGGALQGAKFSPEVKIAVSVTASTRGRLFTFLPLPIFTGFPVHLHALFGIDGSRANLRRDSVGLVSGSWGHMKVQWNTMLFQTFIPRSWCSLLEAMVSMGLVSDIFSIWPPEKFSGELESYCSSLSGQLVSALLSAKAAVWPAYEPQNETTRFGTLASLVVASSIERESVLQALARLGVSLTRPPKYVFDLLCNLPEVRVLNPEVAHGLLLGKVDEIPQASEVDQKVLLEFLLSTENVLNICGLPLIPTADGKRLTLTNVPGDPAYTMLTRSEFEIFGPCDDSAIPLHQLPPHVADTLLKLGPSSANIQKLGVPRIVEYLSIYPNRLGLYLSERRKDLNAVRWLSKFWEWMNAYEHRDELFPQIRNFFLLPSTKGLRKAESALFKLRDEHPAYTAGYIALGVPFLSQELSDAAHDVLRHYGLAKLIWDIPALIDSLASISLAEVSQPECESILKHLAPKLDGSIGQARIQRLRNLPIFPVLTYTTTGRSSSVVTNWTAIPQGHVVRSVSGRPRFIPSINGITFVGLNNIAPSVVEFLEPSHPSSMPENELVELAVENFNIQPDYLQLALLRHIADNKNRIFPAVIAKLCKQAFVLAEDGGYRVPAEIVDPDSDVGPLYIGCPEYRPSTVQRLWLESSMYLRSLKLLRSHLTPEIAAERIEYISSKHTSDEALLIARNLLYLLGSTNMDFSLVPGISQKRWLPTNRGICSADACRHAGITPLVLFDRVLAVLTVPGCFAMPSPLQTALGWDKPLSIKSLIEQLDGVLNSGLIYDTVVEMIKEFGRRQWSDEDLVSLEQTIRDRQWIPTTGGTLADIKSSFFESSPNMINSGFYQIRTDLKAESLLRRMGCANHPSTRAILEKLHSLHQDSSHVDVVGTAVRLLKSLPDNIANMERTKLLIPDRDSRLRPFSKVYYNDIGENSRLVNTGSHFIAHPSIDESLARKLGLDRLGLGLGFDLGNIGPNMGQSPLTTVRRTLQQYTNKQLLLEFLANAEDAKATEFKIAINLNTVHEEQDLCVLDSAMTYLCKLPSLVVYNDAQFTPQDFEGICYTSVGGKEGRSDTIGEFGQGVLTMYHLTDLAMIISGSCVLFMDPSKKHLPLEDIASLTLPLQLVQQFYKDHLLPVDGLFDFDMSSPSYNGTLFVLPLRGPTHQSQEFIVPEFWSPERLNSEILEPFRKLASDCLLFTAIRTISCFTRADQDVVVNWSFRAERTQRIENQYVVTDIEVTKSIDSVVRWRTVTALETKNKLPTELQNIFRRPPSAGLAARLDKASPEDGHSFKFFSTLPLSTPTSLPMHIMASFKLSPDRRQIRLDNYEKVEMKYNTWLLEELIPPLYLFLLEDLLDSEDEHYRLRWPTDKGDALSNHIVESFYSLKHLTSSARRLLPSLYYPPHVLSPRDAVLQVDENHNIRKSVDRLKPHQVVDLPSGPRELAERAGVPVVDPDFVKKEVMRNPGAVTSDFDFRIIHEIISYLTHKRNPYEVLCGLPILPLEDGSFGTFHTRGTGPPYYLWKPNDSAKQHNFSGRSFVHPRARGLVKLNLNVFHLDPSIVQRLINEKLSTFPQDSVSLAQLQWVDSFWDSWDEYASPSLGLVPKDIGSFLLVPTIRPTSLVCLDQCQNGDVLLVEGDDELSQTLRTCLLELGLPVVHIDGQIPAALRDILKLEVFPRLNLPNVLSAITKNGIPMQVLFGSLDDHLKFVFATWARANIKQVPEGQIPLALSLPIWWSAGRGTQRSLRPGSEVQLLPKKMSLKNAAKFMADYVAEDPSLTHLNKIHMPLNKLPNQLRLPLVLDMPTLLHYKQFYETWISDLPISCLHPLPVPTSAYTFRPPQELYERGPLFTTVLPEGSPLLVHPEFQEFEGVLCKFGLRTEERLDLEMFIACAETLDVDDPSAVPRAREVFRAYSDILPRRIRNEEQFRWRELDDIAFIPRRMETTRKLPDQGENDSGLDIPMAVTQLPTILTPAEFVKEEFEAIAWSQRACFEVQPSPRACVDHSELGRPTFSIVMAHLRYLSEQSFLSIRPSQRRILLHDLGKVYQYLDENLDCLCENEELAQTILFALRDERLFLNIDDQTDELNWVQGISLAFDCHDREGPIQEVRAFLFPFQKILVAAGALTVQHPSYKPEQDARQAESAKLQSIWSSFNQLRMEKALTDVRFNPQGDPDLEPLFAHRVILAASSEYFRDYFIGDFQESQNASADDPHTIRPPYSRECVGAFLGYIYTGSKGGDLSLELLLEILDLSNYYHVKDLFDEIQGEIIQRRLLRPETVDSIKSVAGPRHAVCLLNACTQYESENAEFMRRSWRSSTTG